MKREYVKDFINIEEENFYGPISKVCDNLKKIEKSLKDRGIKDIVCKWFGNYDYQEVRFHFLRPETDDEMKKREKRIKKKLEKLEIEKKERRDLYLELKKEFEE